MPMTEDKPPWWMDSIKTLGLPTILLLALGYGLWTSLQWYADKILVPQQASQKQYIEKASQLMDQLAVSTAETSVKIGGQSEHTTEILHNTARIKDTTDNTNAELKLQGERSKAVTEKMLHVLQNIEENTKPLREGMP